MEICSAAVNSDTNTLGTLSLTNLIKQVLAATGKKIEFGMNSVSH